jgi:hypothetical protein
MAPGCHYTMMVILQCVQKYGMVKENSTYVTQLLNYLFQGKVILAKEELISKKDFNECVRANGHNFSSLFFF